MSEHYLNAGAVIQMYVNNTFGDEKKKILYSLIMTKIKENNFPRPYIKARIKQRPCYEEESICPSVLNF